MPTKSGMGVFKNTTKNPSKDDLLNAGKLTLKCIKKGFEEYTNKKTPQSAKRFVVRGETER